MVVERWDVPRPALYMVVLLVSLVVGWGVVGTHLLGLLPAGVLAPATEQHAHLTAATAVATVTKPTATASAAVGTRDGVGAGAATAVPMATAVPTATPAPPVPAAAAAPAAPATTAAAVAAPAVAGGEESDEKTEVLPQAVPGLGAGGGVAAGP